MKEGALKFLLQLGIAGAPPLTFWLLLKIVELLKIGWRQDLSLGYMLFVFFPLWVIFIGWALLFRSYRSTNDHWRAFLTALLIASSVQSFMFWLMLYD